MKTTKPLTIFPSKRLFITLGLSCGAILGVMSSLGQPTLAQSADILQNSESFPSNEQDSQSGSFGNNISPFDLIHQINLNNNRSLEEFNNETAKNLDDAAADFRRQQLERLNSQRSQSSTNSTTEN